MDDWCSPASCWLRQPGEGPVEPYRTYADAYLAELMPLLGPIRSLDVAAVGYRFHGANDFLSLGVSPAWLRRKIDLVELGHHHVRGLASQLGLAGVPERSTDLRDAAFLGYRLASLRLEPDRHPVVGDAAHTLALRGVQASLTNPLLWWRGRLRRAAWFAAAGLVPGPPGRAIARRWLPDGPGRRRGWPRRVPTPARV